MYSRLCFKVLCSIKVDICLILLGRFSGISICLSKNICCLNSFIYSCISWERRIHSNWFFLVISIEILYVFCKCFRFFSFSTLFRRFSLYSFFSFTFTSPEFIIFYLIRIKLIFTNMVWNSNNFCCSSF